MHGKQEERLLIQIGRTLKKFRILKSWSLENLANDAEITINQNRKSRKSRN